MSKVNVLVVEDDPSTRLLYKKVFPEKFYDCTFAADGETALNKYVTRSPDLIVLDMMLPVVPGFIVLNKIRKEFNDTTTKIVVSTALTSKEDIIACTKLGIQGYIKKPFYFKDVRNRIMTLMGIEDTIEDSTDNPSEDDARSSQANAARASKAKPTGEIKQVVAKCISGKTPESDAVKDIIEISRAQKLDLPTMPEVILRIQETKDEEDLSPKKLANILSSSPALIVKIISLSNSSFYRGVKECSTVEEAIMRVGMTETKELAIILANQGMYALKDRRFETDVDNLFIHSVAVGGAARVIAKHLNRDNLDFIFSLGVLHDVGKLVLLRIFAEIFRKDVGIDLGSLRKFIQTLHDEAGHYYLKSIGFPFLFHQTALLHDTLDQNFDKMELDLPIVVMANLMARKLGFGGESIAPDFDIFSTKASKVLRLEDNILETVSQSIDEYLSLIKQDN